MQHERSVCLGCGNKIPDTQWLKHLFLKVLEAVPFLKHQTSNIKHPTSRCWHTRRLVRSFFLASRLPLPLLRVVTWPCLGAGAWRASLHPPLIRALIPLQGPTLKTPANLNHFPKAPPGAWRLRHQHMNVGAGTPPQTRNLPLPGPVPNKRQLADL